MFRLVFVALALVCAVGKSSGVKWVELTAGDPLPPGTTPYPQSAAIVGRARHFNDILPAQVWPNSTATIDVCGKRIMKHSFAVLTSDRLCYWELLLNFKNLPEDLVIVGHENAQKALFIGSRPEYNRYGSYSGLDRLYGFSLTPNDREYLATNGISVLVCPTERVWLDVSAKKVPKNAVFSGTSIDGHDIFVARLKNQCRIYPGYVIPKEELATTWLGENMIEARYSQVLIGDSDQYSWVPLREDDFPDNAVVGSTDSMHLYYVAKQVSNNLTTYITNLFTDGIENYEILVENVRDRVSSAPQWLPSRHVADTEGSDEGDISYDDESEHDQELHQYDDRNEYENNPHPYRF